MPLAVGLGASRHVWPSPTADSCPTAIGTVSASNSGVAAVFGFFCGSHGSSDGPAVRMDLVLTLLAGGMIAAPLAPLFVAWLDARVLGVVVGGFVCLTTFRTVLRALNATDVAFYSAYALLTLAVSLCIAAASRKAMVTPRNSDNAIGKARRGNGKRRKV